MFCFLKTSFLLTFSILCLIFYRSTYNIFIAQDAFLLESFGFNKNGTYNVTFINKKTPNLYYTLLSSKEFPIELLLSASASKFCRGAPPIPKIRTLVPISNNFTFTGHITDKDTYTPLVYNCNNNETLVQLTQVFRNPHTYLDFRWVSGDWSQFSLGLVLFITLVVWLVNWCCHFRTNVKIHYFVTTSLFLGIGYHLSFFFELLKLDKVDEAPLATSVRLIFSFLYNAGMYITLLLSIKGWCVYRTSLSFKDVFISLIYVLIFTICSCVLTLTTLGKVEIVIHLVSIFVIMLFVRELIISINKTHIHFVAHLYIIANAGVSPTTTPIYAKYKTYVLLRWAVVFCCIFITARLITSLFSNPFLWIDQLIFDLMQIIINIILCITFRLRKSVSEDQYLMLEEDEYEQTKPEEIQLTDIKLIKINDLKEKSGIVWERGIKIPNAPIIKDTIQRYDTSRLPAAKQINIRNSTDNSEYSGELSTQSEEI